MSTLLKIDRDIERERRLQQRAGSPTLGEITPSAGSEVPLGVGGASVLDMCCGPRMMWFDKEDPRAVFLDRRRERHAMNRPKRNTVEWTETDPDILADFTDLPFADETFLHVVFDPPHFERSGKIGFLAMKYGWLDGDWRKMIAAGFAEGFRVLKLGGTLIFKWTATENPVSEILKLTPMQPLYGHKSGKQAQTHWLAFLKGGGGGSETSHRHSESGNSVLNKPSSQKP